MGATHADGPFTVETVDDLTAVVTQSGHTLGGDALVLADVLGTLVGSGRSRLVVELSGTPLPNSKLLDALVQVAARLDPDEGHGLAVVTDAAYVRHMLETARGDGPLLVAATRADALRALG